MAPWVAKNLGKKVTMIFPDFAFGYDHRDFFSAAIKAQGGEVIALIPIPPTETTLHPLLPADPGRHRGDLPRDGRPGGADLRQGTGRILRLRRNPQLFGFIDSLEAVDTREPRPRIPRRHLFLGRPTRAMPARRRPSIDTFYRATVGVDDNGARVSRRRRRLDLFAHVSAAGRRSTSSSRRWRPRATQGPADRRS